MPRVPVPSKPPVPPVATKPLTESPGTDINQRVDKQPATDQHHEQPGDDQHIELFGHHSLRCDTALTVPEGASYP